MRDNFLKGWTALCVFVATGAVLAGVSSADVLTDTLDTAETQLLGYAAPIAAAVAAVVLAFVAVRLIPKVITALGRKLGA